MSVFEHQIESMEQKLHDAVNLEDDHELFINSYLHGQFDLVVSRVLASASPGLAALDEQRKTSLHAAFEDRELEPSDQDRVWTLWQQLVDLAAT